MAFDDIGKELIEIAQKYAAVVKERYNLQSLYLYGSFVKGNFYPDSDIDLAVIADDLTGDAVEDTFRLLQFRRRVDYRIEPHPFVTSEFIKENPMAREIMESGIRIV